MLGRDGNLYGTTAWGGRGITALFPGYGTVFKLTPDGTLTNIYSFAGFDDGGYIYAGLVQGDDGNFYGTTSEGGAGGLGTVFKLSVPLPPVIKGLTLTNGTVTLTWSAVAGQSYRAQYSDDLTQTNWAFLTKPSVANSGVMTATDSDGITSSRHRFYRVVLE